MAYKSLFIVLSLALVHAAVADPEEPCLCAKDDASVWKFLQTLSVDVPDEERDSYVVLPGELSPLIECNCESDRRKRKVLESDESPVDQAKDTPPEVISPPDDSPKDDEADQKVRARKSLKRGSCPLGLVRFGSLCIVEDDDY